MAPPPPPPPPMCFPFSGSKKPKRRLSWSSSEGASRNSVPNSIPQDLSRDPLARKDSYSTSSTLTSHADNLTFVSDSEKYDDVKEMEPIDSKGRPTLGRSNTMTGTKKSTTSNKWGYGWGLGKQKEKEQDLKREMSQRQGSMSSQTPLPVYNGPVRTNSKSTQASRSTQNTQNTYTSHNTRPAELTRGDTQRSRATNHSKTSHRSHQSRASGGSGPPLPRPPFRATDSSDTLIGSALERKMSDDEPAKPRIDSTQRLEDLRREMLKDDLDYYVIPSEDAHGSEYVALSDRRREFISGFGGSAGQAIVTRNSAYLITDSRYWLQASAELDHNWQLVRAGTPGDCRDWIEWLVSRVKGSRIGIDGRMLSYERATLINSKIGALSSKLVYPVQNLIDIVWKDKPAKSVEPVFTQPIEFAGVDASTKLRKLREWIRDQPPDVPSYSRSEPKPSQMHVGTLIASLPSIAYLLNLRGNDIPYNPLFHAYLFVGLDNATIFLERVKVSEDVDAYLKSLDIKRQSYADLWTFLRKREWGEGKVIITPQTSYTISLVLSHFRCTVLPSFIEKMMAIKNDVEVEGMRKAYLRDGVSFVRFLAWLETKLADGYDISEWEAAHYLTAYRRETKNFMGLAYENISASGPNAALPHYTPKKRACSMIDRNTPYLNDSGGHYRDGTCDTTRTVHFGRPDTEQCEAYTRVLQGHIAIDSAVFPLGTSGHQLDVLARRALWKEGLNYLHGTGHGFGSFLTVHEGSHGFSSDVPLEQGHVVTNEPGYYREGKWGMRIESAYVVRKFKTRGEDHGNVWLGFDRLTCVPIQTRMVKESMLTKEEKHWIKEHNQRCLDKLAPLLRDDKRALNWLKREATRGIGLAPAAPGGLTVDWG